MWFRVHHANSHCLGCRTGLIFEDGQLRSLVMYSAFLKSQIGDMANLRTRRACSTEDEQHNDEHDVLLNRELMYDVQYNSGGS